MSCQSVRLAQDIKLYSLKTHPTLAPGEQIGVFEAYDCTLKILGFGPSADLHAAFRQLRAEQPKARYITRMRVERKFRSYAMIDRDCWIIRGIAYR